MPTPTTEDLIYAACAMDCEGCMSIYQIKNKNRVGRVYYTTGTKVVVGNTNRILIDWLYEHFGGGRFLRIKADRNKNCFLWVSSRKDETVAFISAILPYLKMKREQAELLLEYYEMFNQTDPERRQDYRRRMMVLNRKGKSVEANTPDTLLNGKKSRVVKIESELHGDMKRALVVTPETAQELILA